MTYPLIILYRHEHLHKKDPRFLRIKTKYLETSMCPMTTQPTNNTHKWTRFMTDSSPYVWVYIERPLKEAKVLFEARFGQDALREAWVGSDVNLELVSAYERECEFDDTGYYLDTGVPLNEHIQRKDVLVLRASDIKDTSLNPDED